MEKYGVALGKCIYENPLSCEEDIAGFVLEGDAKMNFPNGRLLLENGNILPTGRRQTMCCGALKYFRRMC